MIRWSALVAMGAVLVMGASTAASASFFDVNFDLPAPAYEEEEEVIIFNVPGLGPIMARGAEFTNVSGREPVPSDGVDNDCDSFFDIYIEVSIGGGAWESMDSQGHAQWTFSADTAVAGVRPIEAEMTLMDASGGDLPAGVMIRESPTRASSGGGSCTELGGGGGYQIDSFFDIWVEISVDGGQNWVPADEPMHMDGTPEPATLSLLALGGLGALLRRRRK